MKQRQISDTDFRKALDELAEVSTIAFLLKHELSPLSQEDIQAGAEPLTQGQIQESLDDIQRRIALIALDTLGATSEEWYTATGSVQ